MSEALRARMHKIGEESLVESGVDYGLYVYVEKRDQAALDHIRRRYPDAYYDINHIIAVDFGFLEPGGEVLLQGVRGFLEQTPGFLKIDLREAPSWTKESVAKRNRRVKAFIAEHARYYVCDWSQNSDGMVRVFYVMPKPYENRMEAEQIAQEREHEAYGRRHYGYLC